MSFVVVAIWTSQTGRERDVEEALQQMIAPSRAERGCLDYRVLRALDDPRVFLLYEEYRTQADYEAHLQSAHFRTHATERGIPLLESRERTFYEPLDV
jgi:quinol monooxygenase YgiN